MRSRFTLGFMCGLLLSAIVLTAIMGRGASFSVQPSRLIRPARTQPVENERPPGVPPDAVLREVNGKPYYIIPLA